MKELDKERRKVDKGGRYCCAAKQDNVHVLELRYCANESNEG